MKTICFFSRLSLVDLYGSLDVYLRGEYKVVHLAYSCREESILKNKYGIKDVINFKEALQNEWINSPPTPDLLKEIDDLFINHTNNRFSLSSAINMDRTFRHMSYSDCLMLASNYYHFWNNFISNNNIDAFIHEPVAVFMTHVLSCLCRKADVYFLTQSQVHGCFEHNWIFCEGVENIPIEWPIPASNFNSKVIFNPNAKAFLGGFRTDYAALVSSLNRDIKRMNRSYVSFFIWVCLKSFKTLISSFSGLFLIRKYNLIDHHDWYMTGTATPFFLEIYNRWFQTFKLNYDEYDESDKFYFYPMHAEPEAAVLYRGDGIYEGQIKLIENISEQLPPNVILYVKDHPHRSSFKSMVDVDRLRSIPNIKFIDPLVSGKFLIAKSIGVITISGSSGFEAIMLKKPVYLFGHRFYSLSKQVYSIRNIRDLRKILYDTRNIVYSDKDVLSFVEDYLNIVHEGFVLYFPSSLSKISINHRDNSITVSIGLLKGLKSIFK